MKPHIAQALDNEVAFQRRPGGGTLTVDDSAIDLRMLGRGHFAEAFRDVAGENVYVFVDSTVRDKDIAETVKRKAPTNPHLPDVRWFRRVRGFRDADGYSSEREVYRAPYYQVPPPQDSLAEAIRVRLMACEPRQAVDPGAQRRDVLACARRAPVPQSVIEALELLSEEAATHGAGYVFEFGRENTGVDENGNLILLDVLYPELR